MKKILTILFITIIIQAQGQNEFDGFKILKLPREYIPLGAEWINGVGVNGPGTTTDNIVINKSISRYELNKSIKQSLDLAILSYFNLGVDYLSSASVEYTNLTIYTVKDFSKTDLNSGQLIIYECIKADSIFLRVNKGIEGGLKIKLDSKLRELNVKSNSSLNKGVVFSGEKLFLAFRVFELGKTKVESKSSKIKDTKDGGGLQEVQLMNYKITFNNYYLNQCVVPNEIPINRSRWLNCERTTPIDVVIYNFNKTDINGKPFIEKTNVYNNTYRSLYFTQRQNNLLITDYIEITYKIKDDGRPMLFFYMDSLSKVVIKRMETPLKMYKNPTAPGW